MFHLKILERATRVETAKFSDDACLSMVVRQVGKPTGSRRCTNRAAPSGWTKETTTSSRHRFGPATASGRRAKFFGFIDTAAGQQNKPGTWRAQKAPGVFGILQDVNFLHPRIKIKFAKRRLMKKINTDDEH
jgi:hypothetical protein